MPASDSIFRCNCKQSNSNWPLPGPTLYKQPPLILFLNTTPPILQLSSPGVLAECTASKHSQPAPLDKEKKKKQVRRRKKKRGGCFLFRSSSETGQKFMCITINQNISSYNGQNIKCLQYSFKTSILPNASNGRNLQCSSLLIIQNFFFSPMARCSQCVRQDVRTILSLWQLPQKLRRKHRTIYVYC